MSQKEQGLYGKFYVSRVDGRDVPGGDREGADYFVLDLTFDSYAREALRAYAEKCGEKYPHLARDLQAKLRGD